MEILIPHVVISKGLLIKINCGTIMKIPITERSDGWPKAFSFLPLRAGGGIALKNLLRRAQRFYQLIFCPVTALEGATLQMMKADA